MGFNLIGRDKQDIRKFANTENFENLDEVL